MSKFSKTDRILYAFMYAMSTILGYLRHRVLMDSNDDVPPDADMMVVSTWLHYARIEESLQALAVLCQRVSL